MNRLPYQEKINNELYQWNLPFYYSKSVVSHLVSFIDGMLHVGFTGKLSEIHSFSYNQKHRTTLGYFLKRSPWNEEFLQRLLRKNIDTKIKSSSQESTKPTFLLLDDTVNKKTKPSSQAKSPMESTGFHFSHTNGKSVWGHNQVTMMIQNNEKTYPYDFELFEKDKERSKIQISVDMIKNYSAKTANTYLLCDSWFTSAEIIHTALSKGIHTIGALKSNRIIYPCGIRQQLKDFSQYVTKADTNLVTVGNQTYHIYRYEGNLNQIECGVVLLCWKLGDNLTPENMRCFLSTDIELSNEETLTYYSKRWNIEIYFQQTKGLLGLAGYQFRSKKALNRYWLLVNFVYVLAMDITQSSFHQAVYKIRKQRFDSLISFIYYQTLDGNSLEAIQKKLKAA